jgi:hypothetical protein
VSTTGQKSRKGFIQGPSQNRSITLTYKRINLYENRIGGFNPENNGNGCSEMQKKEICPHTCHEGI